CSFFFQAEDGIRDRNVTGVQTCALPIYLKVYSKALHFMDEIYDVVERFPVYEMYGISNQLRRSVSSIGANVAEGNKSIYYSQERSEERRVGKECRAWRATEQ